jgi:hypothetical protein
MSGKSAALALCGVCAVLAVLLIAGTIRPVVAGAAFAAALVVLGVASGGFVKRRGAK